MGESVLFWVYRWLSLSNNSGNVLFIILIAVALFGALGYAISSSMRGNGSGVSDEKDKLDAAQIVQECAELRNTTMRFMFTGIADSSITVNTGSGATTSPCRTGSTCLFSKTGGQAIIPIPPQVKGSSNAKFNLAPTQTVYYYYNISDAAYLTGYMSNKSLVIFEAFPLSKSLCEQINRALGRDPTPTSNATSDPNFRDACYINSNNSYFFRCPLTH